MTQAVVNEPTINLIEWVTEELTKLGHPEPSRWQQHLNIVPETNPDLPLPLDQQQFKINRVFQLVLGRANVNTFDLRMLLTQFEDVGVWQTCYSKHILPFVAAQQL